MISKKLRAYEDVIQAFQRVVDIVLIVVAHGVACWAYGEPWRRGMGNVTVVAIVVFSIVAELLGVYRPRPSEHVVVAVKPVLVSGMVTAAAIALCPFVTTT